jgi:DeoR/GlpR family transcriptional regulator of sugar metabolism
LTELNKKILRQNQILHWLEYRDQATLEEVVVEFGISEATAHRDLDVLERQDKLIRVRGGVRFLRNYSDIARKFVERRRILMAEKALIAEEAAKHIHESQVVILDNGTTTWFLAKRIKAMKNITVVTNSIPIVEELGGNRNIRLIVSGGIFRKRNLDFTGEDACDFFRNIGADVTVLSCDSVKPSMGIYKLSGTSAALARAMLAGARQVFVVADHSKINAKGTFRFLRTDEKVLFFMDPGLSEKDRQAMEKSAFEIKYCP